jgi:HSP20 family protein
MIVRYWQPFQELDTLRQQLDRAFDEFVGNEPPSSVTWTPSASVVDTGEDYLVSLQIPGVNADSIDVQASRKNLVISGERKTPEYSEGHRVLYNDVRYGTFRRVINLPTAIEHEQVNAHYDNGVLTVRLPKTAETKNQVVKVNISESI